MEIAESQATTFRKDMAARDEATNDKIDKISTAQQSFFAQQKEHERKTEEREANAAARQAQSEARASGGARWPEARAATREGRNDG
eukprot:3716754-Prymnesium_polylepis.1